MQMNYKRTKKKVLGTLLCLFPTLVLIFSPGCAASSGKKAPDFSVHADGTRLTETEIESYQDYAKKTITVSKKKDAVTGTQTGLLSTVTQITLYQCTDTSVLEECFALIAKYETIISRTMPGSELYYVNHSKDETISLSNELAELITLGLTYHERSQKKFDITTAPLSELWDFSAAKPKVPSKEAIENALSFVDSGALSLEGNLLKKPAGAAIDLGAIAKGWIADRLADYLRSKQINNACINLGGNTLVIGEKAVNTPYRIGVTKPFSESEIAGVLTINDLSVVTSGVYERCFVSDQQLYHHILDATTGYPAENGLLSVTIVCENSAIADVLSTTCFLLGEEEGKKLIEDLNEKDPTVPIYAMFVSGAYDSATEKVTNEKTTLTKGFEEATGFTYDKAHYE